MKLLALFLLLAVPARAENTLQFWHSMSGEKGALLQRIVDRFNALPENAGKTRVEMQFVGSYEEGLSKLRTALLAGRGPHLVQITDIGTRLMADSGAVEPIQDFIDHDPEFPLAKILKPIRHYYELDGKLWSLPFATSGPVLYCNADALAAARLKPPRTFDELRDVAAKLTDPSQGKTGLTWPLHSWFFEQLIARQGATLADQGNGRSAPATSVDFTGPAARAAVDLWVGLVRSGSFANVGRGWDPAEQNFLSGRSAILATSTSDVFEIRKKAPFPVTVVAFPGPDLKPGGPVVGGNSLWLMKDKPQAERAAAYRFLKFMASADVQREWHTHTGYFPIREDVIASLEKEGFYKKYPDALAAIVQLRATPDTPATRGALLGTFPEARENVESALELILAGYRTPDAALKWAQERTNETLARYNRGLAAAR